MLKTSNSARKLLSNFDVIAQAPQGVAKLRELILTLAVQGKLVPQDASEEPASMLLERIKAEKVRLVAEGKIKKEKPLTLSIEEEIPFELPVGWEWSNLKTIGLINPRNSEADAVKASFVQMSSIPVEFSVAHASETRLWQEIKTGFTQFSEGDVGVAKITPCFENGKSTVFQNLSNGIGAGTTELHIVRPLGDIDRKYVLLFLKTPGFLKDGEEVMTGSAGQKRLPRSYFESKPFPLPPLAEQSRIVARVESLMQLCDALEAQGQLEAIQHQQLLQALLGSLAQSADAAELAHNWQRVATHFDVLLDRPEAIDALEQTILQLAVRGLLVPQDPTDEPASELLKKIRTEKDRLIAEGKIKRDTLLPAIGDEEKPFVLPLGWEWVRLAGLIRINSGDGLTSAQMAKDGIIPVYGGNGVNGYHDKANVSKPTLVIGRVGYYCGSVHVTPSEAWVTDNAFITKYSENFIDMSWLYWLLRATNLKENDSATAQPVISGKKVYPIVVAFPPLTEQSRIVTRVNELRALCQQLRDQLTQARHTQGLLAQAWVEQAAA
ncbi:restriction endonuclease subunit S [Comamonas fluminis]|uniref:restriction endonuclease subunit S n=1 Tax=Comamonas fluminis TaxID=2796366 RepID=UPI001C477CE2|nr:restriction endonuclease subunit S [Comamonas fluminis]